LVDAIEDRYVLAHGPAPHILFIGGRTELRKLLEDLELLKELLLGEVLRILYSKRIREVDRVPRS
jgi:hypothetical protein